jgi:hypothetical protein
MDYISRAKAKGETPATKKKAAEKEAGNDLQGLLATVCRTARYPLMRREESGLSSWLEQS